MPFPFGSIEVSNSCVPIFRMDKNLSSLWQDAQAIRLTIEESQAIEQRIFATTENLVRVKGEVCHKRRMDRKDTIRSAKNIRLSGSESQDIHKNILFMKLLQTVLCIIGKPSTVIGQLSNATAVGYCIRIAELSNNVLGSWS